MTIIPDEVLLEIFQFIDRHKLEKLQIYSVFVMKEKSCRSWSIGEYESIGICEFDPDRNRRFFVFDIKKSKLIS